MADTQTQEEFDTAMESMSEDELFVGFGDEDESYESVEEDGIETDETDQSDEVEETAEETEQAENTTETVEVETETVEPEGGAEEQNAEADRRWTLKHLDDEPKEYGEEDMIRLAQKGLDYDRIRGDRDAMKSDYSKLKEYENFLTELKGGFDSVEDLIDDTRAALLVENEAKEGRVLDKKEALERVRKNRLASHPKAENKAEPEETAETVPEKTGPSPEEIRQAAINDFVKEYPGVSSKEIPDEVWDEFEKNGRTNLLAPYQRWEVRKLKAENETLRQNKKNEERSTGSLATKGKTPKTDPLFDGWGETDW